MLIDFKNVFVIGSAAAAVLAGVYVIWGPSEGRKRRGNRRGSVRRSVVHFVSVKGARRAPGGVMRVAGAWTVVTTRGKEVVPKYGVVHLALCELTCSNDFRNKQSTEINGRGTGSPMYHLPGNVISATVGLVYNNLQPFILSGAINE